MTAPPVPARTSGRRRLGAGAVVVLVLVALGVTVVIGILRGGGGAGEPVPVETATPTLGAGLAYVHVAGAVVRPGLYAVPGGARVVDAVSAAGGFTPDAVQEAVNLARAVKDGEQLLVPIRGAAPDPAAAAAGTSAGGRVNVNTADAKALDTLPGVGPAIASKIVAWREKNGPFGAVDDLLSVPGIGDRMLENLRDLVTV